MDNDISVITEACNNIQDNVEVLLKNYSEAVDVESNLSFEDLIKQIESIK